MKPESCFGCELHNHGGDFSQIEGTGRNGVLVVAEASGEQEARDLLPLRPYAPSGQIFERTLRRLGLDRQDFAVTNMIRCRPRNNLLSNMPYESQAVNSCRPNLESAYARLQPKVILALGGVAFDYLAGEGSPGRTISHLRGYVFRPSANYSSDISVDADLRDCVILPTYHPSFIRRGSTHLFGVLARDIMRAVNIAKGNDNAYVLDDPLMAMYREELLYQLTPTIDDAWSFYLRCKDQPDSPIAYDIETFESMSLDEDARDEFQDTRVKLVQFSLAESESIVFPWNEEFRKVIAAVMALPNPKCGHNIFQFDNRVLSAVSDAAGTPGLYLPSGPLHDTMLMWKRWQPELPANLQYAATFVQWLFPWKHLNQAQPNFYAAVDADVTLRLFNMLVRSMKQKGIFDHYYSQISQLHDIPAQIASNGLTISQPAVRQVIADINIKQTAILVDMEKVYPNSERTYSPEEGYKKTPKQVEERRRLWNSERMGILIGERTVLDGEDEIDYVRRITGMVERTFQVKIKREGGLLPVVQPVERWCNPNPISPMSRQQIIRYAKSKKHEVPTKKQQDGSTSESLTLDDIDLMFGRTKDKFYWLIGQHRRLTEQKKVAVELDLMGNRGAIHPIFQLDPTGKISTRIYSLPEPKTDLSAGIVAREGCQMVKWEWKGQWERVTAQMVGGDIVQASQQPGGLSKVAWEELKIHPRALDGFLLGESDRAILEANRVIFGTAQKSIADMRGRLLQRWPQILKWQQSQQAKAHQQLSLTSRFGELRWFYEVYAPDGKGGLRAGEQAKSAVEFQPQADCVGAMRWRLGRLQEVDAEWKLVGMARDWLMFEVANEDVWRHVRQLWKVLAMEPAELEGVELPVEVSVGPNWRDWTKLDIR